METPALIIYGHHAVLAALRRESETIIGVWVDSNRHDQRAKEVVDVARRAGISTQRVKRTVLDNMADNKRHQGFLAQSSSHVALDEQALEAMLVALEEPAFLLILDGLQDPHNLGACLRSADAAGVNGVIIPRDKACGLTATVRKVASGAVESVPLYQVTNLVRCMETLKQAGVWLFGAAAEANQSLYDTDLTGSVGLVLGAEGKGLRRLTREKVDVLMGLPMAGTVSSLNISVAAGICLYEVVRQRREK